MTKPFFSIGVTTYNRHDLLREALNSILAQSFTDFEVIVGNDYTAEVLTCEMLGISDPRVRIVNHPRNLREVGNLNSLLATASGRYFTWLFDDDLYEPDYLSIAYEFLAKNDFPPAFFPSFRLLRGLSAFQPQKIAPGRHVLLRGSDFLREYFAGRIKIVSTSGLFDTAALRSTVGNLEELCPSAIGLYSEYLLLVRCALLDRIGYMDVPLIIMRFHTGSWSESNLELHKYLAAGQALVRRSAEVFRHPTLLGDFNANLLGICKVHLYTFAYKSVRLELAQNRFRLGAAYRAISRLAGEVAITRHTFSDETGAKGWYPDVVFLSIQIKHSFLILAWLFVFTVRRFVPGFMRLTRAFTPR